MNHVKVVTTPTVGLNRLAVCVCGHPFVAHEETRACAQCSCQRYQPVRDEED